MLFLPATRAPKLRAANRHAYVVLDGTLIPIDRPAADRPFYSGKHRLYSGKHRRHGMNLQVIADPDGEILSVSGALPSSTHDLTAADLGHHAGLAAAGLIVLADKGYTGAGDPVRTPYRERGKPASQRTPTVPTPGSVLPASEPTPS
jgi:hypothetical protein